MRSVWLFIGLLSSILSILSFAKIYQFWPGLNQELAGLFGIAITFTSFYLMKKAGDKGNTPP